MCFSQSVLPTGAMWNYAKFVRLDNFIHICVFACFGCIIIMLPAPSHCRNDQLPRSDGCPKIAMRLSYKVRAVFKHNSCAPIRWKHTRKHSYTEVDHARLLPWVQTTRAWARICSSQLDSYTCQSQQHTNYSNLIKPNEPHMRRHCAGSGSGCGFGTAAPHPQHPARMPATNNSEDGGFLM